MRIVRIDKIKSERRYVYDIDERDLRRFGPEPVIKKLLESEDATLIDWLENEMIEDTEPEEFDEAEHGVVATEWFEEDDIL